MNNNRGSIICEEAYAQGKMLEHSSWQDILPRNITPSDIDMILDNKGNLLFIELKTDTANWYKLKVGQRLLYENIVNAGKTPICTMAVLCRYKIKPVGEKTDTVKDILEFSFMKQGKDGIVRSPIYPAANWIHFIKWWLSL